MKVRTSTAAAQLDIHPSHLLQHVAELDKSLCFEDVWPEIEQDLVETISVSKEHRRTHNISEISDRGPAINKYDLSDAAIRILDKLFRQNKWGDVYVNFEALGKLTHLSSHDLRHAITELGRKRFLDHDGTGRGTVSLDPARHKEIELIAQQRAAADAAKLRR